MRLFLVSLACLIGAALCSPVRQDINKSLARNKRAALDPQCFDNGTPLSGHPFEKPGDCDHFYQCSNGYLYTMPCAPGTAFNPAIGVCDWPHKVQGCGATDPPTDPPTTTTVSPFHDDCVGANGNPQSGDPFEKPGDCDHFYQCSNGYRHTMPCAPGTAFNPEIGVCDHPYNVPGCGGTTTESAPPTTTTTVPFDDECVNTNGNPVSSDPFEKPGDCDHFYQCSNGYLHTMPCAPGTVFNPAIGVCDHPHNVPGCGGTVAPPTAPPTDPPTSPPYDDSCIDASGRPISGDPFEKPGDCDHFYQCSNGYRHTMPCAPGTVFNSAIGVCDHPYNVPGCGGTVAPPTASPTDPPTSPPYDVECVNANGIPVSGNPFEKPNDCDHFYQCSNGYLHTMPCVSGTVFNPAIGVCDHPYNVPGCGGTVATPTAPPTDPPTLPPYDVECVNANGIPVSGNPFEKPNDCDHFNQCSNGYLHTIPCPSGTAFNPAIGVCDHSENVPGCEGSGSGPSPPVTSPPVTSPPFDDDCVDTNGLPVSGAPFEKSGDCEHFYQCSNGYRHTMPCAPGTVFNPKIGVCDHPYNVPGCGGTTTAAAAVPTTTVKPFDGDCVDANGNPISGDPFEKSGDCEHFYQCSNGYLHTMPCAPGTVFNPAIGVCDHPYNVPGCGGTVAPPTTPPTDPPTSPPYDVGCVDANGNPVSGAPFEKPNDCDHFYQCSNGYKHTMPCAPGTVFNSAIGVCDHPENVPGCGGTVPPTTTLAPTNPPVQLDPQCEDVNGNPISGDPFEKPGDCDHFYQCSNGYLYTMPCAPGTVFSPAIGVCDHPENVPACNPTPPAPTCEDANGKPLSTGPLEKLGDCNNFYQCGAGILYTMPCAPGTVFNPSISVCDWPYNVPGC